MKKLLTFLFLTLFTGYSIPQISIAGYTITKEVKWQKQLDMDITDVMIRGDKVILADNQHPFSVIVFTNTGNLVYNYSNAGYLYCIDADSSGNKVISSTLIDEEVYKILLHKISAGSRDSLIYDTPNMSISNNGKYMVTRYGTIDGITDFNLYDTETMEPVEAGISRGNKNYQSVFAGNKVVVITQHSVPGENKYGPQKIVSAVATLYNPAKNKIEREINLTGKSGDPIRLGGPEEALSVYRKEKRILFLGREKLISNPETIMVFDYDLNLLLQKKLKFADNIEGIRSAAVIDRYILVKSYYKETKILNVLELFDMQGKPLWRSVLGRGYYENINGVIETPDGKAFVLNLKTGEKIQSVIINKADGKTLGVENGSLAVSDENGIRAVIKNNVLYYFKD